MQLPIKPTKHLSSYAERLILSEAPIALSRYPEKYKYELFWVPSNFPALLGQAIGKMERKRFQVSLPNKTSYEVPLENTFEPEPNG